MFGVSGLRYQQLMGRSRTGTRRLRARLAIALWAVCWVTGHVAGGLFLGAALGLLGLLIPAGARPAALGGMVVLCLAAALHQLKLFRLPLPQLHRQVPRTWLAWWPGEMVALGYGLQLGCGVATRIKVASTYVVLGCALLSGSATAGALLLGLFGGARSVLPVLLAPQAASPRSSLLLALSFDEQEERVGKLNGVILLLAAPFLVAVAWSAWGG